MNDGELYIDVILPVPVTHSFVYKWEADTDKVDYIKPVVGQRVLVPFGTRMLLGIIRRVGIDRPDYETKFIKKIIDREPCLSKLLIDLLEWASEYYFHPLGDVFKQFLPHKDTALETNKFYSLNLYPFRREEIEVIEYLKKKKIISKHTLTNKFGSGAINRLAKSDILKAVFKTDMQKRGSQNIPEMKQTYPQSGNNNLIYTHDNSIESETPVAGVTLTEEQKNIIDSFAIHLKKRSFLTALLMGVTGSGKTEIYMRIIAKAIENGTNAIVLVPEIALTPQLVQRFTERFGNLVGVMHSGIKPSALRETQADILNGRIRIVIGVRSVIFTPVKNVGVIVVDEEHEHTYKQEDRFRYNARDVAIMRGKFERAFVILGSATPSLESYYNAISGKYRLYRLPYRIRNLPMPDIHVVDLKKEHPHKIGNEILTEPVVEALSETFSKGKQAIIMLNKRGYSSSLICVDCGYAGRCAECDIALTYHKTTHRLMCHYCGYSTVVWQKCPACGSNNIKTVGIGTQRLEEEIKRIFGNINFIRMDRDTTLKTGSHERLINIFGTGDVLLLLGTQMVAKGLDFPNVELVCLPLLDIGLNVPDFRSAERIFNIITQSAGRAGRFTTGARVFIQTYNPDYYAVKCAVEYNINEFYDTELKNRKELFYPPFSRIALFIFKHKTINKLQAVMERISRELAVVPKDIQVSGPVPSPIMRMKGFYVYHILLRSAKTQHLLHTLHYLNGRFKGLLDDVACIVDVDPQYFI